MKTTVLILTFRRPGLLRECLTSVFAARSNLPNPEEMEVMIVINGEDSEGELVVRDFSTVQVVRTVRCPNGEARNFGIREASGEFICFLDDDLTVPENYFQVAQRILRETPPIDVLGGPDQTPPGSNDLERAIGACLASPWVTGPTYRRHFPGAANSSAQEKDLILCNLWVRKSSLKTYGLQFDRRLERNEENMLIASFPKEARIEYRPELRVFHRRRSQLSQFAGQVKRSGESRAKMFLLNPKTIRPYYLVPSLFLLALPWIGAPLLWLYLVFAIAAATITVLRSREFRASPWIFVIHLTVHSIYGLAMLAAFARHFVPIGSRARGRHTE